MVPFLIATGVIVTGVTFACGYGVAVATHGSIGAEIAFVLVLSGTLLWVSSTGSVPLRELIRPFVSLSVWMGLLTLLGGYVHSRRVRRAADSG